MVLFLFQCRISCHFYILSFRRIFEIYKIFQNFTLLRIFSKPKYHFTHYLKFFIDFWHCLRWSRFIPFLTFFFVTHFSNHFKKILRIWLVKSFSQIFVFLYRFHGVVSFDVEFLPCWRFWVFYKDFCNRSCAGIFFQYKNSTFEGSNFFLESIIK